MVAWEQIKGNWNQIKGEARVKWGKLTDDDMEVVAGHRDKLMGILQERYGIEKDEAERQISEWEDAQGTRS